ncbi:MAG TPA: 3D domain-containing protein [Candidatus Saccharimonadales bacterium]|nr:3D domain-containing protein [Candidatus Saccharimonadales bacterium]
MRAFTVLLAGRTTGFVSSFEGFFALLFARVNYFSTGAVFLILVFFLFEFIFPKASLATGQSTESFTLAPLSKPLTESLFTNSVSLKTEVLKYKTVQVSDPSLQPGETKVVKPGSTGKKVLQVTTVFHNGEKYSSDTSIVSETSPKEEVIAVSPQILTQTISTPYGPLKYTTKLSVWATSYDANCNGCSATTAIGLKAGYGVIAVDPKVIPLRSKVYVPGYGIAVAGDTGGSIKGNRIDLGFDDIKNGSWHAQTTDLYILAN